MVPKLTLEQFIRSVKQNKGVTHSMLLGAGASIESGIPSADDCIWEWKRDIYTSHNPQHLEKYNNSKNEVVQSVIQKWLDRQSGYPENGHADEYTFYAEAAYPIPGDRRRYFQNLFSGTKGSIGYDLICMLAEYGTIKSVWTTNFDGLTFKTASNYALTAIEVTLESQDRIFRPTSSDEMMYIALHGDYKYGDTKNINSELDAQDEILINALTHELSNRNMIVIGYSGRDKSLMSALKQAYSNKGAGRLYWCGYGNSIPEPVEDLLRLATESGREAYFIPTDGFDQTMLKITLACFENDSAQMTKVKELMYKKDATLNRNTPFNINMGEVNKVIKSNLIPVILPKKIYEFKINTRDGAKEWDVCKELRKKRIVIVPFKGKLYSFSNYNVIRKELSSRIEGEINIIDLDKYKFENISVFKELAIASIAEGLSRGKGFEFDGRSKIWIKDKPFHKIYGSKSIMGFQGVRLSLISDLNNIYVAFLPMCYIEDYKSYDKASVSSFYKQFDLFVSGGKPNYGVESYIKKWIKQLIGENILAVDYSSDQEKMTFKFGCNSLYVGLKAYNYKGNSIPQYVSSKQIALKGEELEDPQLCFYNPQYKSYVSDFHPMRGLINNQPYDFSMGMELQKQEVNIGVLCPVGYEENLILFLNGLKNKHNAHVNPDYLLPYPGFSNVYGISLNTPIKESENWVSYEPNNEENRKSACYKLGEEINSALLKLHENNSIDVILVYIPNDYEVFSSFKDDTEKFDLHDYVKAFAVQNNISTQFLREETIKSSLDCQIAWSLSLAFYVKSLRTPWILSKQNEDVAYAGIGYSLAHGNENNFIVGCSHIYSSNGQGMKYKLSRLNDFTLDHKNNPYLSEEEAYKLGVSIKELFFKSFSELPKRVVVHKRTRFTENEINGLVNSLIGKGIEQLDLIEINYEDSARFFELKNDDIDGFPVRRGTCFPISKNTALLYTHGIAPSVRNPKYKYIQGGKGLPVPLKVVKHYGQSDISLIGSEILGLSKMNWNSFELYSKLPCTIESANVISRIGKYLDYFDGKIYDYRNFM